MDPFVIEAGINHFGKTKEANLILNFFLKSNFKKITFMLASEEFYSKQKKKGIDFKLEKCFYQNAIKKCHYKNKKIGLSVSSEENFQKLIDLKFDFYKLLSLSINNFKLIKILKNLNKPVYVSTGHGATNTKIKKCLKAFGNMKKKITILHTPMTYSPNEINFSRIKELEKTFLLPAGYSNHHNDINSLNLLSAYNPKTVFVYCKPKRKAKRIYPDDKHALYLDELEKMRLNYIKFFSMNQKIRDIKKIKIFTDKFIF